MDSASEPFGANKRGDGVSATSIEYSLSRGTASDELSAPLEARTNPLDIAGVPPLSAQDREVLIAYARAEDRGAQSISCSVRYLAERGWLAGIRIIAVPGVRPTKSTQSTRRLACLLSEVAEVNLPLARLYEGHVNAAYLVGRYAELDLRTAMTRAVSNGALLGVWGADDGLPVVLTPDGQSLIGRKRFASGLGVVTHAVVTSRTDAGVQLCLAEVADQRFADPSSWQMSGMRATVSGTYDFSALPAHTVTPFGSTDCFNQEPGLVGGVWRIAAVQLGGVYALLEAARAQLQALSRLDNEAQIARLTPLLYRAEAARHLVEQAASYVDGLTASESPERAVAQSIFARLLTEELAQDTIAAVERSVGLAHFAEGADSGRIARDLATYIRQVAPDAFLQRSGREALFAGVALSQLFSER